MFKRLMFFSFVLISFSSLSCNDDTTTLCSTNDLNILGLNGQIKSIQTVSTAKYKPTPNALHDSVYTESHTDFFNLEGYLTDISYAGNQNNRHNTILFNEDSTMKERVSGFWTDTSKTIHYYENCRIVKCQDRSYTSYFEYDEFGGLALKTLIGRMGDTAAVFQYTSENNRIVKIELLYRGESLEQTTHYKYDSAGRVVQFRIVNNEDIELINYKHKYRRNGQLTKTVSVLDEEIISVVKYSYDKQANWIRLTRKNKVHGNSSVISRVICYC